MQCIDAQTGMDPEDRGGVGSNNEIGLGRRQQSLRLAPARGQVPLKNKMVVDDVRDFWGRPVATDANNFADAATIKEAPRQYARPIYALVAFVQAGHCRFRYPGNA